MRSFALAVAAVAFLAAYAHAQNAADYEPEITRVAVFKNGYAFTYREGEASLSNGWAYTSKAPIGVLGTVWGYSKDPGTKVVQLVTSESDSGAEEDVRSIAEFLYANRGRRATFYLSNHDKEQTGNYELFYPDIDLRDMPRNFNPLNYNFSYQYLQQLTVALRTETGTMVFPATSVKMVEVLGETVTRLPRKTKRLGIKLDQNASGRKVTLGLAALERGIRWIPAYRIEVKGSPINEAKVELEAMIINELTDLKGAEVFFVVGSPTFLFQDSVSPLSLNSAFAGVSSYFRTDRSSRSPYLNSLSANITSQSISYSDDDDDDGPGATVVDEERLQTFSAEQLFLYQSPALSLKKGESASLRLFSLTVPAKEVFEWNIDDPARDRRSSSTGSSISVPDLEQVVWSAVRLENKTQMPWTTGPAITFREWKPIGQNLLTFTPIGGERIVRITPATEVIGSHKIEEVSRVTVPKSVGGSTYNYDLVTVKGTMKIGNVRDTPVKLMITRSLEGEALSAEMDGKISLTAADLRSVNPNSRIKWELDVPKGETEIVYTYRVYVTR